VRGATQLSTGCYESFFFWYSTWAARRSTTHNVEKMPAFAYRLRLFPRMRGTEAAPAELSVRHLRDAFVTETLTPLALIAEDRAFLITKS